MAEVLLPIYQKPADGMQIDTCAPQFAAVRGGKIKLHALTKGHYPGVLIQSTQLPGISSLGFWSGSGAQDWGLEAHRNEGLEICFLETGAMAFSVEAKNIELRAGHFTVTRPWQLHKLGAPNIGPGKLHWLILDVGVRRPNQKWRWPRWVTLTPGDKAELTRKLRHNETPLWDASPEIADAFRRLSRGVLEWEKPYAESRMINALNQLLLGMIAVLTEQATRQNPELASRRRTVELFLLDLARNDSSCSEVWTLSEMAAHCGMGVTAFSGYCRQLVNNGPVEYLNACRLDLAARRLRESPAKPVTEIAFECGFNSSQYFATVFKRRFKLPPGDYRAQKGPDPMDLDGGGLAV